VPGANTLCDGAAACQVWKSSSGSFYFTASLGTLASVRFQDTVNGVVVTAKGGTESLSNDRNYVLTILCPSNGVSEENPRFLNLNEDTMTYSFGWTHTAACAGSATTSPGGTTDPNNNNNNNNNNDGSKLDDGWVMIILLFVFLLLYCVGGAMVMYTRGARGVEMMPHKSFWTDFPTLVRDGCKYTLSKIRRTDGYSNVR
jgi:hypothetical protein